MRKFTQFLISRLSVYRSSIGTFYLIGLFIVLGVGVFAQSPPEAINYQAILRDAETSEVLSNQSVYIFVEFVQGPGGDVFYSEEFTSVETDVFGLINLRLGAGSPVSGSFSSILWSGGNVWLRLSLDRGSGMTILQETPFSTVPYAFFAGEAGNSSDADTEPTNELIEGIELTDDGNLIFVESGQTFTINLSSLIEDADADPENELVDSLVYNEETAKLVLFQREESFEVDLTSLIDTGTGNPTDEIQDLELNDNTLSITLNGSATPIDLSPYFDNTDSQDLELSGSTLSLTGDATPVDLNTLPGLGDDADADPDNEIQDLSLSGDELTITANPAATSIDLSPYLDNTDNQNLELSGSTLSLTGDATPVDLSTLPGLGDDADADPTNELQNLQLSGNFLSLTNIPLAAQIDLSPYDNSQLSEGAIFVGNASDQAEEVTVTGDMTLSSTGNSTVTGIQSVPVDPEAPEDGEVLIYDNLSNSWIPQPLPPTPTSGTSYYSVDPLDFVEIPSVSNGIDLDEHNVMKHYEAGAPFVMMRDDGSIVDVGAPLHLPHGAEIQNIRIYFTDNGLGIMQFRLSRKDVTDFSNTAEAILLDLSLPLAFGNEVINLPVSVGNTVDNSRYVYRLLVRFTDRVEEDQPAIDEVEQRIYGAVIQYSMD